MNREPRLELDRVRENDWCFIAAIFKATSQLSDTELKVSLLNSLEDLSPVLRDNTEEQTLEISFSCRGLSEYSAVGFGVASLLQASESAGITALYVTNAKLISEEEADLAIRSRLPMNFKDVTLSAIDIEREIMAAQEIDSTLFFGTE